MPFRVTVCVFTVEKTVAVWVTVVPLIESVEIDVPCRLTVTVLVCVGKVVVLATVEMEEMVEVNV